jgi:hypothetical protein
MFPDNSAFQHNAHPPYCLRHLILLDASPTRQGNICWNKFEACNAAEIEDGFRTSEASPQAVNITSNRKVDITGQLGIVSVLPYLLAAKDLSGVLRECWPHYDPRTPHFWLKECHH